jgi:predicted metalloprotease with PDZ domain
MIELGEQSLIDPGQRRDAIRVCAHELFHAWNVCRLKPAPLGKLDHARGNFPDALWVAEGFTRYYEFVLGSRANEITPEIFFSNILNYYRYLAAMPAYARVSAKDSSLATFLNHGKYPGSINNTVDYYDVGMLIAFDLDVLLRSGGRSLDQDFRAFYEAYVGKGDGFTSADLRAFFADRMREAGALLETEVEGPGALSTVAKIESLGFEVERGQVPKLGIVLEKDQGPVIDNVLDTGPSANSGLAAGDEIIRVDGLAFHAQSLRWLASHAQAITLEVKRGHRFFTLEVRPQAQEDLTGLVWRGTEAQAAAIRQWLGRDEFRPTLGQRFSIATYDNFHGVQTVI